MGGGGQVVSEPVRHQTSFSVATTEPSARTVTNIHASMSRIESPPITKGRSRSR